ncbi:MAG: IPT/TIG domain-containing protein [Candidatus Acidiferrales bacterium]
MRLRWAALTLAAVMTILLIECSSSAPITPTPVISSIFPDSIVAGSASFPVFITGDNFVTKPQTMVLWNGSQRTAVLNATTGQLIVTILASDVMNTGMGVISLVNPPPGGASISGESFTIFPVDKEAPTITSLSPSSAKTGTKGPFLLTVNGTNFATGAYLEWNGSFRQPIIGTSTSTVLTTDLMTSDLATAGVGSVTVVNPLPGGLIVSSISVDFTIGSSSAAQPAFPQVVSVNAIGGPSNGHSAAPAISSDGRYVAFVSTATNLVPVGGPGHVFVRDTCLGANNCTPATFPVDTGAGGGPPNAGVVGPVSISGDGRYVAFASYATNLVSTGSSDGPGKVSHVFIRNSCFGAGTLTSCVPTTEEIAPAATEISSVFSADSPSLSADGRFIAFRTGSPASLAGSSVSNASVFVGDTCHGAWAPANCAPRTIALPPGEDSGVSVQRFHPSISPDGRFVVFDSSAPTGSGAPDSGTVFLGDTCLGEAAPANCTPKTVPVSNSMDPKFTYARSQTAAVSADGRFVAFRADKIAAAGSGSALALRGQIFLRDTCLGSTAPSNCAPSTSLISADSADNPGNAESFSPGIDSGGRFVSFVSFASNLATGVTQSSARVFVHDTCFGASAVCVPGTISITPAGAVSADLEATSDGVWPVPLTAGGRFAAFYALSAQGASAPVSGKGDVFLTTTPFK